MSSTENEDLHQSYSTLKELYDKVLKEKQDALEETERATISFACHFDSEVRFNFCTRRKTVYHHVRKAKLTTE
jgi:hypothetical protein